MYYFIIYSVVNCFNGGMRGTWIYCTLQVADLLSLLCAKIFPQFQSCPLIRPSVFSSRQPSVTRNDNDQLN